MRCSAWASVILGRRMDRAKAPLDIHPDRQTLMVIGLLPCIEGDQNLDHHQQDHNEINHCVLHGSELWIHRQPCRASGGLTPPGPTPHGAVFCLASQMC